MLDILEVPLRKLDIRFVRLDGSMSHTLREQSISTFNNDPQVNIFLVSMKAGGLGLNLVAANVVYLLDPWWNPATEQQVSLIK